MDAVIRGITRNPTIGRDTFDTITDGLARAGISIEQVANQLVEEGIAKLAAAFDELFSVLARKREHA